VNPPLVAEVVRGRIIESTHHADLVIVGDDGGVVDSAGDPLVHAAFRSAAKPIQAGVCTELGWKPAQDEHLAIACSSHNGEPLHVAVVTELLAAADLDVKVLRCPPALPSQALPDVVADAGAPARIYNNCSGKHAAMLVTCATRGWPLESYREPGHPLQQAIGETMEHLAGSLLETATDGCGVVTFAAPLTALARAFGSLTRDEPFLAAAAAMRAHPFLVAGTGRLCTATMEALREITVKIGAEGLVCAAGPGFSLALKVRDGSARATGPFLAEALRRTAALPDPLPPGLEQHVRPPVRGGGRPAGLIRIRG
jgi:L-asparaginase II